MISKLEQELMFQIKAAKLPIPITEFRFDPKRKWRADFCWITDTKKLIIEVEGGIWTKGRHSRPIGFIKDCEKYNEAILRGFAVMRITGEHIKNGQALKWIEEYLNNEI